MQSEEILRKYIAETILFSDHYPYADTDGFMEHGILDSVNVMELVGFLERGFGIQVRDQEIVPENFDSIQRLSDFIRRKADPACESIAA